MSLAEPQSLLCFGARPTCFAVSPEDPDVSARDQCNPPASLSVKIDADPTAGVVAIQLAVPLVRPLGRRAQIAPSIVGAIAVQVINLFGIPARHPQACDAVGLDGLAPYRAGQVAFAVDVAQSRLAGVLGIPASAHAIGANNTGGKSLRRSRLPREHASKGVVVEQLPDEFLSDNDLLSHDGLHERSMWLGLVEAVQTLPSPLSYTKSAAHFQ